MLAFSIASFSTGISNSSNATQTSSFSTFVQDLQLCKPITVQASDHGSSSNVWVKRADGWHYYLSNGTSKIGWLYDNSAWYYFDNNGKMMTGWVKDKGAWYYLAANGKMKTGWLKDKGAWYYLAANGKMATGWVKGKLGSGVSYYLAEKWLLVGLKTVVLGTT